MCENISWKTQVRVMITSFYYFMVQITFWQLYWHFITQWRDLNVYNANYAEGKNVCVQKWFACKRLQF